VDVTAETFGMGLGKPRGVSVPIKCLTLDEEEQKDESQAASSSISNATKSFNSFCK